LLKGSEEKLREQVEKKCCRLANKSCGEMLLVRGLRKKRSGRSKFSEDISQSVVVRWILRLHGVYSAGAEEGSMLGRVGVVDRDHEEHGSTRRSAIEPLRERSGRFGHGSCELARGDIPTTM
jgi:hypothetical protein